jgi:hypothetical protein
MNAITMLAVASVIGLASQNVQADFPTLTTTAVIPGCKIARSVDGSDASFAAMSKVFADNPPLGMDTAYCAAWASEAFDRYADRPHCFSNDISVDDLILVVIQYADKHPELNWMPFLSIAGGAILDRWPDCVKQEK